MAEARSAVTEPHVDHLEEGRDTLKDFAMAWRKAFFRRFFATRNTIINGMWPTSIWNLGVTVSIFSILLLGDWQWAQPINTRLHAIGNLLFIHEGLPQLLRVLLISFLGGVVFFIILMYKRRWILRILLSYRGWLYEPPRTQSWSTVLWGLTVRIISGYHCTMNSYQKSLPSLPVPNLSTTIDKFLVSVKPLYKEESEEYQRLKDDSQVFLKTVGPKLQRVLMLKSWWAQNWVTDWWEKYVYLMGRTPIAINSNYYVLDHGFWKPTHRQISRAASAVYEFLNQKRLIDREQLTPLVIRNTIPLCMGQYDKVFGCTRIPGEEIDQLAKYENCKHLMVMRRGIYYKIDILDSQGNPLTPQSLEKQFEWIIHDADKHISDYNSTSLSLASLTGIDRTEWWNIRKTHLSTGVNKDSLDALESAAFHVVLDTEAPETWSERGKRLLHGDGKLLWFDKSFNLVFFADGRHGINAEHSWGDAPVMAHVSEQNLTNEVVTGMFNEDGTCKVPTVSYTQAPLKRPVRLVWETPAPLETCVQKALAVNIKNNADLDLQIVDHNAFGKGFIKKCKMSPDAFVQCALQLAYYRDAGKFALTYEASMTRLYLLGRTETVRSLTVDCANFVRAMEDGSAKNEEIINLLRLACDSHTKLYKDAMSGAGIDRHMFGLFVVQKGMGYENDFLKEALTMPWTLSTSQQPQQQIASSPDCNQPQYKDKVCPGGGFGPVSDKGYGVSYMIPGDDRIFFHISSKISTANTSSEKFAKHLFSSMADMRSLFEQQ